jgi:drug/metabolite transporter, DME family
MANRDSASRLSAHSLGLLAIALAAALWAIAATVARDLFDRGVSPAELTTARATVAAIGLAFINRDWSIPADRQTRRNTLAFGLSIALVTATYYLAIEHLEVAVAVVLQYCAPALLVLWVAITTKRAPSREITFALILALTGVIFASELPASGAGELDLVGIAAGLGSAVCFAAYTLFSEKIGALYGPTGAMFRAFFVASIFWNVIMIFVGWSDTIFRLENLLPILFIGVFGTLIPFSMYVWGVRHVEPERGIIAATLEPPFAALVAWLWLGQTLSPMQIVGGILVIAAVAAVQLLRAEREPVLQPPPG